MPWTLDMHFFTVQVGYDTGAPQLSVLFPEIPRMKSKERSTMRQLLSQVAHNLARAVVAVLAVVAADLCCTSLEQVAVFLAAVGGLGYVMSRRHTAQVRLYQPLAHCTVCVVLLDLISCV